MASVTLNHVTKQYAKASQPAVDDLSLQVQDREFLVIVGPSGCGKSTTLRLVAGLETPTGGTISVGDRVVTNTPPADRDIAMVFQNYVLFPHMSVYRNMAFGLHLRRRQLGMTHAQIRARVVSTAEALGLAEVLERSPRALSGGQKQRVALGRAMVRQPQAFLFDEPLSHLDAKLRVETRAELKKLHRRLQITTLHVTHDQEEAMTLGDRIAVMKGGRIHQCAPPLEVYRRPANRFVAGFIGTPGMNFLPGRMEGAQAFAYANGLLRLPAALATAAARYGGGSLVLGMRPEALSPTPFTGQGPDENFIRAKMSWVEPLGDRVDISLVTEGGQVLVCRSDSQVFGKLAMDGIISIYVDLGRVHLFEPGDDGVNITLTRESGHAAA